MLGARPEVFNHNIETVAGCTRRCAARRRATTGALAAPAREGARRLPRADEVRDHRRPRRDERRGGRDDARPRAHGVDVVTIGQYLQPARSTRGSTAGCTRTSSAGCASRARRSASARSSPAARPSSYRADEQRHAAETGRAPSPTEEAAGAPRHTSFSQVLASSLPPVCFAARGGRNGCATPPPPCLRWSSRMPARGGAPSPRPRSNWPRRAARRQGQRFATRSRWSHVHRRRRAKRMLGVGASREAASRPSSRSPRSGRRQRRSGPGRRRARQQGLCSRSSRGCKLQETRGPAGAGPVPFATDRQDG